MVPIDNPEISISKHLIPLSNPEDGRIQFRRGGNLRSRIDVTFRGMRYPAVWYRNICDRRNMSPLNVKIEVTGFLEILLPL